MSCRRKLSSGSRITVRAALFALLLATHPHEQNAIPILAHLAQLLGIGARTAVQVGAQVGDDIGRVAAAASGPVGAVVANGGDDTVRLLASSTDDIAQASASQGSSLLGLAREAAGSTATAVSANPISSYLAYESPRIAVASVAHGTANGASTGLGQAAASGSANLFSSSLSGGAAATTPQILRSAAMLADDTPAMLSRLTADLAKLSLGGADDVAVGAAKATGSEAIKRAASQGAVNFGVNWGDDVINAGSNAASAPVSNYWAVLAGQPANAAKATPFFDDLLQAGSRVAGVADDVAAATANGAARSASSGAATGAIPKVFSNIGSAGAGQAAGSGAAQAATQGSSNIAAGVSQTASASAAAAGSGGAASATAQGASNLGIGITRAGSRASILTAAGASAQAIRNARSVGAVLRLVGRAMITKRGQFLVFGVGGTGTITAISIAVQMHLFEEETAVLVETADKATRLATEAMEIAQGLALALNLTVEHIERMKEGIALTAGAIQKVNRILQTTNMTRESIDAAVVRLTDALLGNSPMAIINTRPPPGFIHGSPTRLEHWVPFHYRNGHYMLITFIGPDGVERGVTISTTSGDVVQYADDQSDRDGIPRNPNPPVFNDGSNHRGTRQHAIDYLPGNVDENEIVFPTDGNGVNVPREGDVVKQRDGANCNSADCRVIAIRHDSQVVTASPRQSPRRGRTEFGQENNNYQDGQQGNNDYQDGQQGGGYRRRRSIFDGESDNEEEAMRHTLVTFAHRDQLTPSPTRAPSPPPNCDCMTAPTHPEIENLVLPQEKARAVAGGICSCPGRVPFHPEIQHLTIAREEGSEMVDAFFQRSYSHRAPTTESTPTSSAAAAGTTTTTTTTTAAAAATTTTTRVPTTTTTTTRRTGSGVQQHQRQQTGAGGVAETSTTNRGKRSVDAISKDIDTETDDKVDLVSGEEEDECSIVHKAIDAGTYFTETSLLFISRLQEFGNENMTYCNQLYGVSDHHSIVKKECQGDECNMCLLFQLATQVLYVVATGTSLADYSNINELHSGRFVKCLGINSDEIIIEDINSIYEKAKQVAGLWNITAEKQDFSKDMLKDIRFGVNANMVVESECSAIHDNLALADSFNELATYASGFVYALDSDEIEQCNTWLQTDNQAVECYDESEECDCKRFTVATNMLYQLVGLQRKLNYSFIKELSSGGATQCFNIVNNDTIIAVY